MALVMLAVSLECWMYVTPGSPGSLLLTPPRNLQSFNSLILGNVPLFQTDTILTAPEIILHPNASEIDKMCVHCVRNCVEITKVRADVSVWIHRGLVAPDGWPTGFGKRIAKEVANPGSALLLVHTVGLLPGSSSTPLEPRVAYAGLIPAPFSPLHAITTSPMAFNPIPRETTTHVRLQPRPLCCSPCYSSHLSPG